MLAGISVGYYLRLERGRAHNPSPQILEALARALQLDGNATQHLRDLAGPTGPDTSDSEAGTHALADVIDQFSMPAIVANRYQDVLAANPIARALSPEFTPGQSFMRWRVLDPPPGSSTSIGTRRPLAPWAGCETSPVPVQTIRACAH